MPDAPDAVVTALWAALGLWAIWWGVPLALSAVGATQYANGGTEDPAAVEPDGTDPAYAAAFDALRRLGYEPVGPGFMQLTFHMRDWVYRTKVRAFRKPRAGRFAFLHEGPHLPGWHQLFFATCWADGGLDLTCGGFRESDSADDGFASETVPTDDPAALEARHADRVAGREADGRRRDPDLGLDTLLDATGRHARASTLGPTARIAAVEFRLVGFPLVLLVGVPAVLLGAWHWLPPAAGLFGLCVYAWLVRQKKTQTGAHVRARAADQQDAGW